MRSQSSELPAIRLAFSAVRSATSASKPWLRNACRLSSPTACGSAEAVGNTRIRPPASRCISAKTATLLSSSRPPITASFLPLAAAADVGRSAISAGQPTGTRRTPRSSLCTR